MQYAMAFASSTHAVSVSFVIEEGRSWFLRLLTHLWMALSDISHCLLIACEHEQENLTSWSNVTHAAWTLRNHICVPVFPGPRDNESFYRELLIVDLDLQSQLY